jgi:hypothetical protein
LTWLSDVANDVPLMCVYLMFALSEASRAKGVWLLVGPSLFGIRARLDSKGFGVTYGNLGVMVVREICPPLVQMI